MASWTFANVFASSPGTFASPSTSSSSATTSVSVTLSAMESTDGSDGSDIAPRDSRLLMAAKMPAATSTPRKGRRSRSSRS